jgi:hypothetical protein
MAAGFGRFDPCENGKLLAARAFKPKQEPTHPLHLP